ncbi:MAG: uroporphyrinogen-III synthase [Magnetococcus sp. MYC-9]
MQEINLQGRTLLITRPQPEAATTAQQVVDCRGTPLLAPALTILPPRDPRPLQQALQQSHHYQGILVTSVNGARAIVAAAPSPFLPPPFFAVGAQTAALLHQQGWSVHTPAAAAGGEAMAEAIRQWVPLHTDVPRSPIMRKGFLLVQAEQGREELATALQQAGYRVDKVTAYRAEPMTTLPTGVQTALAEGGVDAVLFFSGRSAESFVAALPQHGREWLNAPCIAAISPVTAQVVQQLGYRVAVTARRPDSLELLAALHRHWRPSPPLAM